MELNYSKKQMQPMIAKFAINPETNTTFHKIIEMFDGMPNYQLWAVKSVFSRNLSMEGLELIHGWLTENKSLIKSLSKNGNVVCYTSAEDIECLMVEIANLNQINLAKTVISMFNTDQRKIMTTACEVNKCSSTSLTPTFIKWYELFLKFYRCSQSRKGHIIHRASAVRDASSIFKNISTALEERYCWERGELLTYVSNNTPDCKVVFDKDNVVVLDVPSYKSSNKLCNGTTSWCITNSDAQWKNYVTDNRNKQYFLFDFSKPEKDELSHIAFTLTKNNGFRAAHSCSDRDMLGDKVQYKGKRWSIQDALKAVGVGLAVFMQRDGSEKRKFEWTATSIIDFVKKHKKQYAIALNENNKIIVNVLNDDALINLCGYGLIRLNSMPINNESKCYVLFDLARDENDEKSIICLYFRKDRYKVDSLQLMYDSFGSDITSTNYLTQVGIEIDSFINRENIDPSIMLHKYIDENNEESALKLLKKHPNIDVNMEFNGKTAIFNAVGHRMCKLVGAIIASDKFDANIVDGFGESLIENLLYFFYLNIGTENLGKEQHENVRLMIETIIDSGKFDLNHVDCNYDTAINIACMNQNMLWIVEKLAAMPEINLNQVNDALPGYTCLGNALRKGNLEAVKILGKRDDLLVRDVDHKLAKRMGINLYDYIKPKSEHVVSEKKVSTKSETYKYEELFKKVFAK